MLRTSLCRTAMNGDRCHRDTSPVKNPGTATVLSYLITGLGQVYNGQIAKGLFLVFLQLMNIALLYVLIGYVSFILPWIYGIVEVYRGAERFNTRGA